MKKICYSGIEVHGSYCMPFNCLLLQKWCVRLIIPMTPSLGVCIRAFVRTIASLLFFPVIVQESILTCWVSAFFDEILRKIICVSVSGC